MQKTKIIFGGYMSEVRLGDYNRGGYIAFMFSMAFTMIFFVYIAFIHPGVNLNELEVEKKDAAVETQATPPAEQTAE
jgi:hypothetical protein